MADTATKPIYLSVGRQDKKRIRRLKRGQGKLVDRVYDAIHAEPPGLQRDGNVLPIVILVRKKDRRVRGLGGLGLLRLPLSSC